MMLSITRRQQCYRLILNNNISTLRATRTQRPQQKSFQNPRRSASSSSSTAHPLDGDSGIIATRIHHSMTTGLAIMTPILFFMPDSYTDGIFNRTFGLLLSVNIAGHSWIGLNYVATDYIPKISKALLPPTRMLNAGIGLITLLGMSSIALFSPKGIKGTVKALWIPKEEENQEEEEGK